MSTNGLIRRIGQVGVVVTAASLAVVFSGGGVASAHVTARVIGETATQGGFTKITFRVPNEDDTAGTTKLEVKIPQETPIASLRTKPIPGWTAQIVKGKLDKPIKSHNSEITEGVTSVTWTANPGTRINPGEFGEFEVSGGPMPEVDKLILPAFQTYDNNKTVPWDAPPPAAGAEEPEHPAPVVALAKKPAEGEATAPANNNNAQANAAPGNGGSTSASASASASTTDKTARWLGGIGLVVGALGLGIGAGATLRARKAVASAKAATAGQGS
jgi:periplasmic copper chaperone A